MRTFIFCLQLSGIGANPPFVIPRPTALTAAADLPMMGSAQDPGIQRFGKSDASRVNQCLQVIKKVQLNIETREKSNLMTPVWPLTVLDCRIGLEQASHMTDLPFRPFKTTRCSSF